MEKKYIFRTNLFDALKLCEKIFSKTLDSNFWNIECLTSNGSSGIYLQNDDHENNKLDKRVFACICTSYTWYIVSICFVFSTAASAG